LHYSRNIFFYPSYFKNLHFCCCSFFSLHIKRKGIMIMIIHASKRIRQCRVKQHFSSFSSSSFPGHSTGEDKHFVFFLLFLPPLSLFPHSFEHCQNPKEHNPHPLMMRKPGESCPASGSSLVILPSIRAAQGGLAPQRCDGTGIGSISLPLPL